MAGVIATYVRGHGSRDQSADTTTSFRAKRTKCFTFPAPTPPVGAPKQRFQSRVATEPSHSRFAPPNPNGAGGNDAIGKNGHTKSGTGDGKNDHAKGRTGEDEGTRGARVWRFLKATQ